MKANKQTLRLLSSKKLLQKEPSGNKFKIGANLKTEITRKQSTPNFPKNEHFFSLDTYT